LPADAPVPIAGPSRVRFCAFSTKCAPSPKDGGQLYADGDGLALGYLNAPDLTQQGIADLPQDPRNGSIELAISSGATTGCISSDADNQIR
jgi:hypothetical protein